MSSPNDKGPNLIRVLKHQEEYGTEFGFRPGTKVHPIPSQFFFTDAGMGDLINYMSAILWNAKHFPWCRGTLHVPTFFLPLAQHWLQRYRHWKVLDGELGYTIEEATPIIGPELKDEKGANLTPQLINATGTHLLELGFMYYSNMSPAPKEATYPRLQPSAHLLPPELKVLKKRYVVFTPGGVTTSRMVKAKHLNPLIKYVKEKCLLPVFLGKEDFSAEIKTQFDPDILYGEGLKLINKTNLFQAAAIMENALCVTGLDNGLLHLAACTDATILFGYNIASPKQREPRRTWGKLINMTVEEAELPCIHCQDKWKLLSTHTFHKCLYGDSLCIDLLFKDDAEKWKKAIDSVLPPT